MNLSDHICLWNHAFIKVIDIRHTVMAQEEELRSYRLPASAFLYAVRGSARVWLDQNIHMAKHFHVLHGGKGLCLDIIADDKFEYYLIFYKATLPLPCRQELLQLMERSNPFQHYYAFAPQYPLSLFVKLEQMDMEWQQSNTLEKFHVKSLFYQFVYELLRQLHHQGVKPLKPDLVAQAIRYICEHFSGPVTLESIALALECSAGHLSKLFKDKLKTSPIHYLGQVRADRTAQLLLQTDATLQEIADRVGFPDAHSLSRSFKKYKGLSPAQYKAKHQSGYHSGHQDEDLPSSKRRFAVLPGISNLYNDSDNHYHEKDKGERTMYRSVKTSALTALLCVSLLLSACSSTNNLSGGSPTPTKNVETPVNSSNPNGGQEAAPEAKTRIVSTLKGDVEVPAEPKRVASDQYMGQLLKLGIVPAGVRTYMLNEGWMEKAGITKETLSGIEDLGGFPMNPEKLADLEPDLIIGSLEKTIEQYEKIGTTVFLPYWEGESTAGPLEKFRRISEIFGKEKEADQWIAEYEQKTAEAREKIKGIIKDGETVSVIQIGEKAIYALAAKGGNYGSVTIYQSLQLPPTKAALNMPEGYALISLEVLPEYLGDHVFVYVNSKEDSEQILNSQLWKGLPAVKNNQVYMYGTLNDEFVMEDPYSLEIQLDTIVNILLKKKG
ncbi:AraC family transcriptional regulator [Paenibacillus eucommiae]|uniref:Iron complex transport system substrate-binding protein n=1 Tax=Paenibacillus eucommiae TaxID=1355755 RepID=A0ABS4JAI7_9BACL|nr:AraC family transcriptional regulator [Paenibacillus eucommiae]MBP1996862.1 iron complex transport system substrate-binding protein [Paenibacillus eucommiae]